jgi:hypothetical protein
MNNAFQAALAATGVPTSQGAAFGVAASFGQPQAAPSALDTIETGTRRAGARIVISGVEKVGKTTLACNAPRVAYPPGNGLRRNAGIEDEVDRKYLNLWRRWKT